VPNQDLSGPPEEPDPISHVRGEPRVDLARLSVIAAAARSAVRNPVIVILVLAGIADALSGNPVHSILLFSVAIALAFAGEAPVVVDMPVHMGVVDGTATSARGNAWSYPVLVLGMISYAVLVGGFGRYSWPATIAVIVPGAAAIVAAWRRPISRVPASARLDDTIGPTVWGSLLVALGLFELANLLLQPSLTTDSYAHPTLSVLTDPLLATHPGRSAALLLWLAGGWFLVRR
jgi:hypothetical protein